MPPNPNLRIVQDFQPHFMKTFPKKGHRQPGPGRINPLTKNNLVMNPINGSPSYIQSNPSIYVSFWGPDWKSGFTDYNGFTSSQASNYVLTFLNQLGGSSWANSQTQYCQGIAAGTQRCPLSAQFVHNPTGLVRKAVVDSTPVTWGSNPDLDAASAALRLKNLIFGSNPAPADATFIVYTGFGNDEPGLFSSGYCAYHRAIPDPQHNLFSFSYIPYLTDAGPECGTFWVNSSSDSFGHGWFDGYSLATGHEEMEAVTDPHLDTGWADPQLGSGGENGDKCFDSTTWPAANVTFGSQYFAVQPLWSNALGGCVYLGPTIEGLGGQITSGPAAASWGPNHLDVFARGTDGAIQHISYNAAWHTWDNLGGVSYQGNKPAAVSWGTNRIDLFVRGTDSQLYHKWWDGSRWAGWEPLGGVLASGPTVTAWASNRLDVFVQGSDNQLYHKWWDRSHWSGWEPLGGVLASGPGAASWGPNRIDVFVQGTNNATYHRWWDGTAWRGYEALTPAGSLTGSPSAASWGQGRLDVYALDSPGGTVLHEWYDASVSGGWNGLSSTYGSLGTTSGAWTSTPAAVARSFNHVDVFARRPDGTLGHLLI